MRSARMMVREPPLIWNKFRPSNRIEKFSEMDHLASPGRIEGVLPRLSEFCFESIEMPHIAVAVGVIAGCEIRPKGLFTDDQIIDGLCRILRAVLVRAFAEAVRF